ncbi:predicted protein [Nematostella vectensis]|uniref:Tudor domain-containing protein n=1 Tax=Nematostella vectensis TaxID=45351 RepID=A7SJP4_NEMVE|nr:predicted protein [Nematostella vectensis]|eukprot:XP_001628142.1 predicted protein [Nematostella vectensis]
MTYFSCKTQPSSLTVSEVSLVDYGNTAWVPEKCLKRMLPQFLHLPFQAIECLLANAEPAGDDGRWSKEAGNIVWAKFIANYSSQIIYYTLIVVIKTLFEKKILDLKNKIKAKQHSPKNYDICVWEWMDLKKAACILGLTFSIFACFVPVLLVDLFLFRFSEKFESLTADKVLIAQVLSSSEATNMLFLDLYDTSKDEVHINLEMVRLGHARRTKVVLEGPREPSENGPEEIITPG